MINLSSKTMARILAVLLDNPLEEFKEIELIEKAKTGKGAASHLINNLVKEGLLIEERLGRTKLVSLNLFHPQTFLLKNLFNQEKLSRLPDSKLSSVILFKKEAEKYSFLIVLFGSTLAGTATEKSDIDLLIVTNNPGQIQKIRKKTEELLGERFNLHLYSRKEITQKIKIDNFLLNAFLKGTILSGYNLGKEIFLNLKEKKEFPERLFYFLERTKAALRNYLNGDYPATKEILERLLEQVIFYLLAERGIPYTSKKDAGESIKKLPEGKTIQKINKAQLKQRINLVEKLVSDLLKEKILETEGYVKRGN